MRPDNLAKGRQITNLAGAALLVMGGLMLGGWGGGIACLGLWLVLSSLPLVP